MTAIEKEGADTIELIWNEYHHAKPTTVSAALTAPQYNELMEKGAAAPLFIYPVPKGDHPEHFVLV